MTLTEVVVAEFIEHYLSKSNDRDGSSRKRKRNGDIDGIRQPKCTRLEKQQSRKILPSLIKIASELDEFIVNSREREERFSGLIAPLLPLLLGGKQKDQQQYTDAFDSVADELFYRGVTWSCIVTFLVYNGELASKVTEQTKSEEKSARMVAQIIDNICRYFDEKLMQWIDKQDGGWLNIIAYEGDIQFDDDLDESLSHPTNGVDNSSSRHMKQIISMAALAAVIGGLYMCSKLAVQ